MNVGTYRPKNYKNRVLGGFINITINIVGWLIFDDILMHALLGVKQNRARQIE